MPPKFKFTKEEIITAALDITRESGSAGLTARALAARLGTSAKPIFGQFKSMDEVQSEVMLVADKLYQSYIENGMSDGKYPPYKASGMAYIRFAREETELFRLLFMRNRSGESIEENRDELRPMLDMIMENLGIDEESAYMLHLELWIFVHGIAVMAATSYLDWDEEFTSRTLTDVYNGLRCRFAGK